MKRSVLQAALLIQLTLISISVYSQVRGERESPVIVAVAEYFPPYLLLDNWTDTDEAISSGRADLEGDAGVTALEHLEEKSLQFFSTPISDLFALLNGEVRALVYPRPVMEQKRAI